MFGVFWWENTGSRISPDVRAEGVRTAALFDRPYVVPPTVAPEFTGLPSSGWYEAPLRRCGLVSLLGVELLPMSVTVCVGRLVLRGDELVYVFEGRRDAHCGRVTAKWPVVDQLQLGPNVSVLGLHPD